MYTHSPTSIHIHICRDSEREKGLPSLLHPSVAPPLPQSNRTTVTQTSSCMPRRCPPRGRRLSVRGAIPCRAATRTRASSTNASLAVCGPVAAAEEEEEEAVVAVLLSVGHGRV